MSQSFGILKASVQDGAVSVEDADGILEAMIAAGFHSPASRVSDVM